MLRKRTFALSFVVLALLLVGIHFFNYVPDDTFITLRYARHVINGEGFVFNRGERLEGYTNFLWLIIIVSCGKLGLPLILSARTLSFIFSLGTLVLAGFAAWRLPPRVPRGSWNHSLGIMLPPMLLAASAPFLTWSLSGTEIPLFTFLLLLGFILARVGKNPGAVFVVFGLLGLVRPEGLLFYALAGIMLLVRYPAKREIIVKGAAILLLFYTPYFIWKWQYFGGMLPNTFYAKTGPMRLLFRNGSRYLAGFFASYGYLVVLGLIFLRKHLSQAKSVTIPLSFILVHWIAVFMLGGDWMPHFRFLLPTLPLIMILISSGLMEAGAGIIAPTAEGEKTGDAEANTGMREEKRWSNPIPIVVMMLVFLTMIPGGVNYDDFAAERTTVRAFASLGKRLYEILPPGSSIACGSTGAIGYYTDLPIIDILGLTEAHIARNGHIVASQPGHMKTDGAYVLSKKPDLLLLGNIQIHRGKRGRSEMKHKIQESEIIMQTEFFRDYEFVNIPIGHNFHLSCYKRKEFFLPLEP